MAKSVKLTIAVNAPVEKTWEFLMNPDYLKHWLTGFVSIQHVSGNIGEAGSVSRMKLIERGKEMEIKEKVLHVTKYKQYTFTMEHKSMESLVDIRLISLGNRSEIIQAVQFTPSGLFIKLLFPVIKGEMKKRMENDLMKLKELIEKTQ